MNKLKSLLMCPLGLLAMPSMGQNAVDFTVNAPQKGTYYCNSSVNPILAENTKSLSPIEYSVNGLVYTEGDEITTYGLLHFLSFIFDEKMDVEDGAYGYIECDGNIVEKGEVFKLKPSEDVSVFFDKLKLPKGKDYKFVVPANTVFLSENPEMRVGELAFNFHVGDKFPAEVEDSWKTKCSRQGDSFEFSFRTETVENDDGAIFLYRAGIPIMKFPLVFAYADFDLGLARCEFGRELNFEKGVNYSFFLPEGAVHSAERDDIVNAESRYDFVGAYDKTFDPIEYASYSIEGDLTTLGEVSVDYSTSVQLAPDARLQLVDETGDVLAESAAALAENGNVWHLKADFGGIRLAGDVKYSLCVPEATVVGTGSDITVNLRTLVPIDGSVTAMGDVAAVRPHIALGDGKLTVSGLECGSQVCVYAPDGTVLGRTCAETNEARLALPSLPLYIIKVNGEVYKVSSVR